MRARLRADVGRPTLANSSKGRASPEFAKPTAEIGESVRPQVRMDRQEPWRTNDDAGATGPMHDRLRTSKMLSIETKLNKADEAPGLLLPDADVVEAMRIMPRSSAKEPRLTKSRRLKLLPGQKQLRAGGGRSGLMLSKTDEALPSAALPSTGKLELRRLEPRSENALPRCKKSDTGNEDSKQETPGNSTMKSRHE